MQPWILLEDTTSNAPDQAGLLFEHPIAEICCCLPESLLKHLAAVDQWRRRGYYLAGYISYEAGYVLQGLDTPWQAQPTSPLLCFMVFAKVRALTAHQIAMLLTKEQADYQVSQCQLSVSEDNYTRLFAKVQAAIRNGESYQINLTAKYQFEFSGSALQLYSDLRRAQQVAYSAYACFSDYQLLSLSPELFFKKSAKQLCAKPMKGTAPRADDPSIDQQLMQQLRTEPKSIAENIMIVDLLRNDLARCARRGTLATPELLAVESYQTLHQLISTITCEVEQDIAFETLIKALFPCGSITGAPKRRTMQLIQTLECAARAIYTGAIGYITPENDMCFNVAIRTALVQQGRGELGVGGGIVADSTAGAEYAEMQLKARYFTQCVGAY